MSREIKNKCIPGKLKQQKRTTIKSYGYFLVHKVFLNTKGKYENGGQNFCYWLKVYRHKNGGYSLIPTFLGGDAEDFLFFFNIAQITEYEAIHIEQHQFHGQIMYFLSYQGWSSNHCIK